MDSKTRLVVSTHNRANVYDWERVVEHSGHPLNQLQEKAYNWHVRRLNAVVHRWRFACKDFHIAYLNGKEETGHIKRGKTYPTLFKGRKILDLYQVYNLLPMIGGKPVHTQTYPYLPSKREFLYLDKLTDFRQLHDTD